MEHDPELAPVNAYLEGALGTSPLEPEEAAQWARRAIARAEADHPGSTDTAREPIERPHSSLAARVSSWIGVAAVAGVIITGGIRYFASSDAVRPAASITYQTQPGQHAAITLPNGAHVTLGPASSVDVSSHDNHTSVGLTGKALFTVHASAINTFEVQTATATARVLGTEFLVQEYPGDLESTIAVVDGKVAVRSARADPRADGVTIVARQTALVADSGSIQVLRDGDLLPYTGWTQGSLAFRKTPVRRIVEELTRVYNIDLRVEDSVLAQRTLTWHLETSTQSVAGVLKALTTVLDARVVQTDDGLVLVPGRIMAQPEKLPSMTERRYGR